MGSDPCRLIATAEALYNTVCEYAGIANFDYLRYCPTRPQIVVNM
jgi:hypothetical protein